MIERREQADPDVAKLLQSLGHELRRQRLPAEDIPRRFFSVDAQVKKIMSR